MGALHDPAGIISAAFALCGFAVSIIAGLAAGRAAFDTLAWAILAMVACRVIGGVVASVGLGVVREHVARINAENPMPELMLPGAIPTGNVDKR